MITKYSLTSIRHFLSQSRYSRPKSRKKDDREMSLCRYFIIKYNVVVRNALLLLSNCSSLPHLHKLSRVNRKLVVRGYTKSFL
jgi:hypothetical protein